MDGNNCTMVDEFILVGFTDQLEFQIILFIVFLLVYIIILVGNTGLIIIRRIDSYLQTPMYFFLSNLSFLDMCYSSTIIPKLLVNFLSDRKTILYSSCMTQLYFYAVSATTECYLIAAMAYDRYVAVCNPLLYTVIMSRRVCVWLVLGSYAFGFLNATIQTSFTLKVSFGDSNIINHFFCDWPPLIKLACSDIRLNQILIFVVVGFNEVTTTFIILLSYCCIFSTILRIQTAEGKHKAFSTCTAHLTTVSLFYGTLLFMYLRPSSNFSLEQDKIVSVIYTVAIPFLNPLIYSLRNKEVKVALVKAKKRLSMSK
ncbi:olfactory receptor 5AR1-like [Liasis olivaceus]